MAKAEAGKRYRHYKGGGYEVVGLAQHSETLEELVIYKALYETEDEFHELWARPREMFEGKIEINGVEQDRFSEV